MDRIVFLVTLLCSTVFYGQISFEETTFNDVLAKAKKENKLIFLDAYASWCGPCKLMERNIFSKEKVGEFYNQNFINVHFDMEKGEGRTLATKYQVRSFPTYLFLNGDGEVVLRGMGYLEEKDFLSLGNEAKAIGKDGTAKQRFEKGESDPAFLLNAIKMNAATDFNFAKKVSERYFKVRKKQPYTQEEVFALLNFLQTTNDSTYVNFLEDKDELVKYITESKYDELHRQLELNTILEQAINEDTQTIDESLFLTETAKIIGEEKAKSNLKRLKVNFYGSLGNFKELEKAALDYYGDGEGYNNDELNRIAYTFAEHIQNIESLKKAVIWAEKSVMMAESPESTYILAKLYHRIGKKKEAKNFAELAVKLTKQKGMNASIPEKLLSEIK